MTWKVAYAIGYILFWIQSWKNSTNTPRQACRRLWDVMMLITIVTK